MLASLRSDRWTTSPEQVDDLAGIRRGEEGFSSCLTCPCHHAVATTPPEWVSRQCQSSAAHTALALGTWARPPGLVVFEATYAFTFVTAW